MTPTNLEELKRAAEAATRQGAIKAPHTTKSRKARDDFAALARPSTILSLLAENDRLRSELEAARKPDTYWSYEDPECGWDSFEEPLSEAGYGNEVVRLLTGKTLGEVWAANRVLTVDQNGDPDETEAVCFDNQHDAARCYPDSLATARAHFQSQEASDVR